MRKFAKYKENLSLTSSNGTDWVKSYDTLVAKINWDERTVETLG